jgi:hypothetical protein
VSRLLASFGLAVEAVTNEDGERATELWRPGLALGVRLGLEVMLTGWIWYRIPDSA